MAKLKKRPNYLRISDPKLNKIFLGICAAIFAIASVILFIVVIELVSMGVADPGQDIPSLFPRLEPYIEFIVGIYILLFIAFLTVVIYNYAINKEKANEKQRKVETTSPLLGLSKEQEQQIIAALKTIAQPLPGKTKLNRARTTQFLRALTELGYIDANLDGKIIMPWVESVTGFEDGEPGHFNDQYKKASTFDKNVKAYMKQITQLLHTQA